MKSFAYLIGMAGIFAVLSCNQTKGGKEGKVIYDTIPVTNIKIMPEYYFAGDFIYRTDTAVLEEIVTGRNFPVAMVEAYPQARKLYKELGLSGKPVYTELRGYLQPQNEEKPSQQLVITQVMKMDPDIKSVSSVLTGKYRAEDKILFLNPDHTYKLISQKEKDIQGKWFLISENILSLNSDGKHTLVDINRKEHKLITRDEIPIIYSLVP